MNKHQKEELANMLETLFDLDRFSGCSDLYFRQVYTARIKAIKAGGYREMLLAEIENDNEREEHES